MNSFILYDYYVDAKVRFISFAGKKSRFDLAIILTDQFFGKNLILDMQGSRYAIIGEDDLNEEGYLEHAFQLNREEADELRSFLYENF